MGVQANLGGTGSLTIDGAAQPLGASLTQSAGGLVRAAKVGISGNVSFVSKYAVGMLDIELYDNGMVSTPVIQAISNSTVLWQNDNGKTVVYTGCFQVDEVTSNPVEGTMKFKIGFAAYNEILG